ncbi:MAG: non-homologous end-joining DNA ligase [Actinomycetota bacterium]
MSFRGAPGVDWGMRGIRFGVAGLKDPEDLAGSVAWLVEGGYSACEAQFVKEFTLKEPEAKRFGEMARDQGIALSVHAPYFAQLTTKEPERLKLHLGALHHACKLGGQMRATVVVCHPGSRGDAEPDELFERVDAALGDIGPRIADTGVKLGLETCGRKSQFGTLGDIATLVARHAFTTPVIDYAHIHALSNGSLTTPEAFEALFAYITANFSWEHLWPLHTHFSDNEFGAAGELRHVPYGSGTLRIGNVYEGAKNFDLDITVISESKEASSHEAIKAELASLEPPIAVSGNANNGVAGAGNPPWAPNPIPLEKRGEAHYFRNAAREVRITNWDKIYFPEDGLIKGDLVTYYYNIAPQMMRFLKDRPVNMQRVPSGIYGEAFYEKQAPKGSPGWLRTTPVPAHGEGRVIDYVVVDDVATLVWLAQIASVECHAWTSKLPNLDEPDFAVIDLDPHEPIDFVDVRNVAKLVGILLERLGLKGFPKTSGGAGIQIFIPLGPGHNYKQVRTFCAAIGGLLRAAYPEKVTLEPGKAKRAGKVYVDVDQNAKGQTLVAPYSVRPYPGAPVSAPLTWAELDDEIYPEQFTILTVFDRIQAIGDLFRPAMSVSQDLRPALAQMQSPT